MNAALGQLGDLTASLEQVTPKLHPGWVVSTGEWDLRILPFGGPDLLQRRVISAVFRESPPVRPLIESLVSQLADSMSLTGFGIRE